MALDFVIFAALAIVAYAALDCIVPQDVRCNRVGGLLHWRIGRLGGSFYFSRGSR